MRGVPVHLRRFNTAAAAVLLSSWCFPGEGGRIETFFLIDTAFEYLILYDFIAYINWKSALIINWKSALIII